jgi:glycosyltransferase involved in cell wall biosynthesis
MKIAVALGGTDWGRSGLGTYTRALLPRLLRGLAGTGGGIVALGTERDFAAYGTELEGIERAHVPASTDVPILGAAWYLARLEARARAVRADALLLPAANRRVTLRPRLPTVGVVHDLAQFNVPGKYDRLRTAYARRVVPRGLSSLHALAAASHATRADMARVLDIPSERIHVIPHGVDPERFGAAAADAARVAEARERTGLTEPYLFYPARLEHPGKNHLRLLRAYARSAVRERHLLALAGADWGGEALIREEIQRLGLGARVRLLGFVPDEILPGLMGGASAVLMVGLCEGFGLPALEALAAGRPVVAARAGALPEVVGELGVLCDPFDPADMAAALARALDDGHVARVRREGLAYARERSWDRSFERLLALCRSVGGA